MMTTTAAATATVPGGCPLTNSTWDFTNGFLYNTTNLQITADSTAQGNTNTGME